MKKLIFVNGTMGSGKTTVCDKLYRSLEGSCWLDGDWCWTMHPFVVNEENIKMVEENIAFILNNYIKNSTFDYVIFNWVMHEQEIIDMVLDRLKLELVDEVYTFTLMCSEEVLRERILKDVEEGKRDLDSVERSVMRIGLYERLDTIKVDVNDRSVQDTVDYMIDYIEMN